MTETVRVFAPATVANVACAFDVLGFAIDGVGDEIIARKTEKLGVFIKEISSPFGTLPLDPTKNTAAVSIQAFLNAHGSKIGIEIEIRKGIPYGGGMGSSAASAAAGVFAANCLLGSPCTPKQLIPFAMEGERAACGSAHADNVSPSLLGGFVAVRSYEPLDVFSLPYPKGLAAALVFPHVEVRTEDARRVLKKEIPLRVAVQQFGNIAGLVAGLCLENFELLSKSLEDIIVEPQRAALIPSFYEVKKAALGAGALGCSISGSGPTIFALCQNLAQAQKVSRVMEGVFKTHSIDCTNYSAEVSSNGCRVT